MESPLSTGPTPSSLLNDLIYIFPIKNVANHLISAFTFTCFGGMFDVCKLSKPIQGVLKAAIT